MITAGGKNIFVLHRLTKRMKLFFFSCFFNIISEHQSASIHGWVSSAMDRSLIWLVPVRSFNQPKFCSNASWNPNGTTVANNNTTGSYPYAMFVNTLSTLFVANSQNGRILFWPNASGNLPTDIFANLASPRSLFVTGDEEIFADNGSPSNRVERWTSNGTLLSSPMSVSSQCHGLFIDSNNHLYCSEHTTHQVSRNFLQSPRVIVAGTGCSGFNEYRLSYPWGIFVTLSFDLYVADSANDRVQLFRSGELQGTTVAGNGSNQTTIRLWKPSGVVLDADGYLFIVDNLNHRIIGSDRWGFRCVVGCSGGGTSVVDQLNFPVTMNFDAGGNLLVMDTSNNRVQKFFLATNSCDGESKNEREVPCWSNSIQIQI